MLEIDHLVLTVRSIERTAAFYEKVFGFRLMSADGRARLVTDAAPGFQINLHECGAERLPHAAHPLAGSADLCFLTDRPTAARLSHLALLGIPVECGPVSRIGAAGKMTSLYFRDPDGNLLEWASPED